MSPHYQLIKDLLDLDEASKSRVLQILLDAQTTLSEKHFKVSLKLQALGDKCTSNSLMGACVYYYIFLSWQEEDTWQLSQDYAKQYFELLKDLQ